MSNIPIGHFRGLALIQKHGEVGGARNVFVNLVGNHDDMVYPQFGGKVMNPPKGRAKMFAGDLCEYRPKVGSDELNPEIYILRTFKVASASGTTVNVLRDEFKHRPFVGDVLMVAPAVIGGTGTAATVNAVNAVTVSVSGKSVNAWALTLSANISAKADDVLVEAESAGSNKAMLVKAINGVFDCDTDFLEEENISDVNATFDTDGNVTGVTESDFYKARYQYTPALGGLMWMHKMSPMPQCVLDLNMCNIPNWFHVDWTQNAKKLATLTSRVAALEA